MDFSESNASQEVPQDSEAVVGGSFIRRLSRLCVRMVEQVMPDPFVIAVILTAVTCVLAYAIAPKGTASEILTGWYDGVFKIASFAFLVALTLVTGHALSTSKPVSKLLSAISDRASTPAGAMVLTFFVSLISTLLNWAFGLVVTALFAREIAKRVRVDFAWLVAAAYAGWSFYVCGISSSIALLSASSGSPMNIIEKYTGKVLPMKDFLLSPLNYVPLLVLAVVIPVVFWLMMPSDKEAVPADPQKLKQEDTIAADPPAPSSVAGWLDHSWIVNVTIVGLGAWYIGMKVAAGTFKLDLNMLVLIFLLLGLLMHLKPRAYLKAVNNAARVAGPILLQFPLYGGIMGIMTATGLADWMSEIFVKYSSAQTLPLWTFFSSLIISIFVPSAGGHWVVQAPFAVPAATSLGVHHSAVAIAVAMGEGAADMVQPMWAIPLLAIAGVGLGRVMGYTLIIFFVMCAVMGSVLLFYPHV
ncbi:TIGR00366 family protein [Burkholderia cenocepacia]|uniref:TIGR00366 family protein n=1 Tax=Burkholderia cenocepacia TaxID=95486 RepID=A0ABD4UKS6_9BURK|nr:TIGR00366 family protein [Burkholderia cenocepacia]MCW3698911.1 TIGR00366 family protein [Burkholderia cenocepacia]MCW3706529.1 TIGR00366 family protein [Burkholderia cenocepacia]MCW3714980.1 TIGR00366 family protein [Burkholderia cenocepacia]MCW3722704.1 TIGR00366 family protein [Burkholderia cenocepacia]MCW3729758.1 TIGR00366 family protein [Burkholderia cenocepacia]